LAVAVEHQTPVDLPRVAGEAQQTRLLERGHVLRRQAGTPRVLVPGERTAGAPFGATVLADQLARVGQRRERIDGAGLARRIQRVDDVARIAGELQQLRRIEVDVEAAEARATLRPVQREIQAAGGLRLQVDEA